MNDLTRLAMERAVDRFGGRRDRMFNAACFSSEFKRLAGVSNNIDGNVVRAMLTGRPDVDVLRGDHYKMREAA